MEEKTTATTSAHPAVAPADSFIMREEKDYGSYTAHDGKTTGRLIMNASSVRFVAKMGDTPLWVLPYNEIQNFEKQDRIISKNIPDKLQLKDDSGKDLRFVSKAGEERILKNVDKRDEVFSQVVGFSDTTWQVVW